MLETLIAAILVMLVPSIISNYTMPGGIMGAMVLTKIITVLAILMITLLTNISRSIRFCRDNKGNITSWGISYGLKKGFWCGIIAVIVSIIISLIPALRTPFTVISFIPGLENMVDGFILSILYLLSYLTVAYPIWGSC